MDFRAVLAWENHVGQDVRLSGIHQGGEPWHLGAELVGDVAPLGRHWAWAAGASSWAKAVPTQAETMRRWVFPAWALALRMK
jgi:hypothetical protein